MFCTIARTLAQSTDSAFGGFYRRLRAPRGGLLAKMALARKIATMYWNPLVKGVQFVEQGSASYEKKAAQSEQYLLRKLAGKHDMVLVQKPVAV
jgi:hypothetical protein